MPLVKVFGLAIFSLLLPSFAAADCSSAGARSCVARHAEHDETSLLQVQRTVKIGSTRSETESHEDAWPQQGQPFVADQSQVFVDKAAHGLALPGLPEGMLAARAMEGLAKLAPGHHTPTDFTRENPANAASPGVAGFRYEPPGRAAAIVGLTGESPANAVAPGAPGIPGFRYVLPGFAPGVPAPLGAGALPTGMTLAPRALAVEPPSDVGESSESDTFGPGSLTAATPQDFRTEPLSTGGALPADAFPGVAASVGDAIPRGALPVMDSQQYIPVQALMPGGAQGGAQRQAPAYMVVVSPGKAVSGLPKAVVSPGNAASGLPRTVVSPGNAVPPLNGGISREGYASGAENSVLTPSVSPQHAVRRKAMVETDLDNLMEAGMSDKRSAKAAREDSPAAMTAAERRLAVKAINVYKAAEVRNRAIAELAAKRAAAEKVAAIAEEAVAKAAAHTAVAAKAAQAAEKVVARLDEERTWH